MENSNWVLCKKCKHKLFLIKNGNNFNLDIKCHSCKEINDVHIINIGYNKYYIKSN